MGCLYAKDVCDTALNEVGYEAEGSNKKYTIYSSELDDCNYWNMDPKNGVADWCSIFVNWCIYANTRDENGNIRADKWDAHFFTFEPDQGQNLAAGCGYAADYYMQNDAWDTESKYAKCGDQVFFRNFAHTGLVVDWDNEGIWTVEGNVDGGRVEKRYYKFGDSRIDGFGHPRYDAYEYKKPEVAEPTPEPAPAPKPEKVKITIEVTTEQAELLKEVLKGAKITVE